jgi:hypothetical protein
MRIRGSLRYGVTSESAVIVEEIWPPSVSTIDGAPPL